MIFRIHADKYNAGTGGAEYCVLRVILARLHAHNAGFLAFASRDVFITAATDNHDAHERLIHIFPPLRMRLLDFRFFNGFFHITRTAGKAGIGSAEARGSQHRKTRDFWFVRIVS